MSLATTLAVVALVASIALLAMPRRMYPTLAVLASALEVAMAFGVASLEVQGVSMRLLLGAILVVAGAITWVNSAAKPMVTASTVVIFVGTVQVLGAVGLFG